MYEKQPDTSAQNPQFLFPKTDDEPAPADLPLLTEGRPRHVPREWNATARDYPYEQCLHQLIEAQVERTPDAPAVMFEQETLSYRELNERANQLARYLQHLGVGADLPVSVAMERSFDMVIALLGVLKAGGAYVPLDPGLPAERLAFMLADLSTGTLAQPAVLLTQSWLLAGLPEHGAHVLCLDTAWPRIALEERENLASTSAPGNLAYIIYTSGSTGTPKGAMNTHRGICNRLLWMQETYQLTADDCVLQKTPYSFDVSVWEFFWPLMTGARLVVAKPEGHRESAYLVALIQEQQVTAMHFVPSMLHIFLEEPALEHCADLRLVICSGEALPFPLQERFFARLSCALHNLYGPTEAAIDVTYWPCQRQSERTVVPIGYPIANTQIYILDPAGQPVPPGEQGELYIGGVGVARGYLNRPELTAERFLDDPFSDRPGAHLYRTGDLARYLPDGAIEYLGRLDQQIKLRGFRVELGEIEVALGQHPAVRETVVVARSDRSGDQCLVAYVVLHRAEHTTVNDLRSHLALSLPEYMLPTAFLLLDALPLNPSGKVDRRALPAPAEEPRLSGDVVAPCSALEACIAATWAQVLGLWQVGVNENFFALGGHSLLAMRITSHLRASLQIDLSLRDVFDAPTVAQLAGRVAERQSHHAPRLVAQPLVPRASQRPVQPMSFAQQRLWFLDQLTPRHAAYNIPASIRISAPLDQDALGRSLQVLIARHEVLRTTFAMIDGQPAQLIAPAQHVPLYEVDLRMLSWTQREGAAQRLVREAAAQPFDLSGGPLLRLVALHLAEEEHLLVLVIHHMIADGWSIGVFFQELADLYDAFVDGREATLPDLQVQYADFAAWQQSLVQGGVLEESLAYWKRQLADAPPVLELPADHSRPARPTSRGATYSFRVDGELTEQLQRLSQQEGVTLYMTLVAAFQTLLHRYTGQDDLLLGTAIADRRLPEVQGLLGIFLNTLVLRARFEDNPPVHLLLQRVRESVLDGYAHQDVPFESLVNELHLERVPGHSPLFQVALMLDPPVQLQAGSWRLTRMAVGTGASKFDLALELEELPEGLAGHLEYSTDLFDEATIARLAGHWQVILAGMVANPGCAVGELPLLTEEEQAENLRAWHATRASYPRDRCLHQLFAEQAERTPAAIAVSVEHRSLTYRDLNEHANRFARYLQTLGVGPGALVAICLERSLDMLIGLLGILKAGGAYVPLDPAYPEERLALMLDDADVTLLVTQQALLDRLPAQRGQVVCLDTDEGAYAQLSTANPDVAVGSECLCYVIYTSGSTGRPKGVQITHRAVVNFLHSMQQKPGITAQDTLLAVTTLSFDIAGLELYLPLLTGAHLVLASRDVATSGPALAALLEQSCTTIMQATPITWRLLLASGWAGKPDLKALCGGEALPRELVRDLLPRVGSLYNMYGPTETTIWSTLSPIESPEDPISIGKPIANTWIALLDTRLQPLPAGVPGELYIGGDGLARGYLNRPDLTDERFLWLAGPGKSQQRCYRTGDLARYRSDGTLELIGRADSQVKLHGFRIEPGEIASVLVQHPAVQQAVVIVREDTPGEKRLVAYIQTRQTVTASMLRQHAQARLPSYMVPSALVVLDRLPQTPNGKVDHRALPAPAQDRSGASNRFVAPRSALEVRIAGAWSQALSVSPIGVHDTFFALGGHSLLAMQIISRLRTSLQVEISLRDFFAVPTIAHQAELIACASTADAASIQPQPRPGLAHQACTLPASSGQEGLWFLQQLDPQSPAYTLFVNLRLLNALDLVALKRSLNALVERHEALRTTFGMREGQLLQMISPQVQLPLSRYDLRALDASQREATAVRLANQEMQRPFDLERGPLVRAIVLHLHEREHVLLLTLHHSISDGWSLGLLLQELVAQYETFNLPGAAAPDRHPAGPPLHFGDFAAWQRSRVQESAFDEHLAYWKRTLAGAPTMLAMPTDRPRSASPTWRGAQHTLCLSREFTDALKALCQQEQVTLYMILVAAFQVLLQRSTGQDDLLLGTTTAGRTRAECEATVGYFTNTQVLRADLRGNPTVRELFGRVRESVFNAQLHQDLPFDLLIKELQPERVQGRSPLFQVFLTLDTPLPALPSGWDGTQMDLETGAAKFDLSLDLSERAGRLVGHLEYRVDLFERTTIERLALHWQRILQGMVDDPAQPQSALSLLSEAERRQLLVEWNATAAPYPGEQSIHQLFAEQVERTPAAIAASYAGSELTYQALNERANQLARFLQRRGLRPGGRAGICLDRSLELLVGLLGVLKAGGIYVPLDPGYPAERLAFMLDDAQMTVLLTRRSLVERLPIHPASTVCLDSDWPAIAQERGEEPVAASADHGCASLIYTSGSTGRPKGVLGTHRASLNRFNWMWRTYPFAAAEVCCQKTTLSFVDAVWEIFGPLLQGIRLVILPDEVVKDPVLLLQALAQNRVTRVVLVPSLLRVVLESQDDLAARVPDLRYWVCSGEALAVDLARLFAQRVPGGTLINVYGSSEVAADATCYEVQADLSHPTVPIGRPIDNTQLYVLDRWMQPLPVGVAGELYIGGAGLARGYFNRPELTAARFIADPFCALPGCRLYMTGDRVRYLPDGTLEYLGRLDQQVKLRGMRIELGEIEAALSQHPGVHEAVATLREDPPGDARLVAYVTLQQGQRTGADELLNDLRERLPGYMVPGLLVVLDAFPLTPSGKVDRRALPAPGRLRATTTSGAPETTLHYQLIQIWEDLLNVRPIGVRDDFFALGGHSLLAARLMMRIADVCGKTLPLSILFKSATIEGLAAMMQTEREEQQTRTVVTPIQASGSLRPFFFLHGDWNGKAFYCLKLARELGAQRPFYLLEPYTYDGLHTLPSIEQVAAAHLVAMRQVQPEGPYVLGGWCNGAMVAYEMARQLRAEQQEIALLILMDAGTSSPFSNLLRRVIRAGSSLLQVQQEQQATLFLRILHIYEYLRLWNYRKRLAAQADVERPPEEVEVAHPNFASIFPPKGHLRENYMAIFNWLASGYSVRPYDGDIALFWAEEDSPGRRKAWGRFLAKQQNVKTYLVPGTHMSSRTRYVEVLARRLSECLEEYDAPVAARSNPPGEDRSV